MRKRLLLFISAFVLSLTVGFAQEEESGTESTTIYLTGATVENATVVVKNGETTIDNASEVAVGDELNVTVTPNSGYYFNNDVSADAKTVTINLTQDMVKTGSINVAEEQDYSQFTAGSGTWTQLSETNTYYTKTCGWKVNIPKGDTNEKDITYTATASGKLTFDYAVNNGGPGYGKFMVYLYINGTKVKEYDYYTKNDDGHQYSNDEGYGYKAIRSETGYTVSTGDVIKWVFLRTNSNWGDNGGRYGYIGNVQIPSATVNDVSVIDISSSLTDCAVHQHNYSEETGVCPVCKTKKTYTLADYSNASTNVKSVVVKRKNTDENDNVTEEILSSGTTLTFGDVLVVTITPQDYAKWDDGTENTGAREFDAITVGMEDPNDEIKAKIDLAVCGHSMISGVCNICGYYAALTSSDLVNDYYKIDNAGDLMAFADIVNGTNGAKSNVYAKGKIDDKADIDFSEITSVSYTPIGYKTDCAFRGTFEGNNKTITLKINNSSSEYQGLFGCIKWYCEIKNVTVNGIVKGSKYVGGIAGCVSANYPKITNCHNKAAISGTNYVGGIVGYAYYDCEIAECTNNGAISGSQYVGGIAGSSFYANVNISKCVNESNGKITATSSYAGGITGDADAQTSYTIKITACANRGSVSCSATTTGGIAGHIKYKFEMTSCYNEIDGLSLYGIKDTDNGYTQSFTRCYNKTACDSATVFTYTELGNGALCYNLNGGVKDMYWYQSLAEGSADEHPVLTATDNEANVVNCIKDISDESASKYFNTTNSEAKTVSNTDATKFYVVDATTLAKNNISVDGTNNVNIIVNNEDGTYTCANAVLKDATDYAVPYAYTATKFTYDRTLATADKGITTFMLPIKIAASNVNGTVYKLTGLANNTLNFEEVTGNLEPNTPYLVECNSTEGTQKLFNEALSGVSVSAMEAGSVTADNATHYAFYTNKTSEANGSEEYFSGKTLYGYADGKFVKATGTWTLPAFHTLIAVTGKSNAPSLSIDLGDGGTSGISSAEANGDSESVNVYSISGMKVRTGVNSGNALRDLPAGVYIVNGKKVVKK